MKSEDKIDIKVKDATPKDPPKKSPERIDLAPSIEKLLASFPEGVEIEVSGVKGGKRIDLIRGDVVTRLVSGLTTRDVRWYLEGGAKLRAIK